jgi:hypothetical protein
MKTWRRGGTVLPLLISGLDGGGWPASSPGSFYFREIRPPPVSIEEEAGWAPEPVWTLWGRKKSCPYREPNPSRPARSWHIPTELSRLLFTWCIYMFRTILRINSNCLPKQHFQPGIFNADALSFSVQYEMHTHTHTHTTYFEFLLAYIRDLLCSKSALSLTIVLC